MTGRTSQIPPTRDPGATGMRRRHAVLCLVTGLAILVAGFLALEHFPDTELGRAIDAHLTQLADPESWIR